MRTERFLKSAPVEIMMKFAGGASVRITTKTITEHQSPAEIYRRMETNTVVQKMTNRTEVPKKKHRKGKGWNVREDTLHLATGGGRNACQWRKGGQTIITVAIVTTLTARRTIMILRI